MKRTVQIDDIDRRITRALQGDATLSSVDLANIAGASAASCWRRVKALEANGVLGRAVRLIDPALMGKGVTVFCHVRLKSHGESSEAEFRTFVDGRSEIMECYSISGEWDFMLRIIVGDVEDYEHFLMRTLLKQAVVATASSLFALRQIKYTTEIPL